jgi:GntR family transcriptional regulator
MVGSGPGDCLSYDVRRPISTQHGSRLQPHHLALRPEGLASSDGRRPYGRGHLRPRLGRRMSSMDRLPMRDRRPMSLQLGDMVRQMIVEEGMQPGDRLPSESELAARFGLGRGSVREALKLLEQDGLINVRHGLGRFVSAIGSLEVDRPVTKYESITQMLGARGFAYTTDVLSAEVVIGRADETAALNLPKRAKVVRLRRIRRTGKRLLVYSVNSFPASFLDGALPDPEVFSDSLTSWLGESGKTPVSSAAQIRATSLPEDVTPLDPSDLEIQWLLITERCVAEGGDPVLYSLDYHRGDVFGFHVLRRQ